MTRIVARSYHRFERPGLRRCGRPSPYTSPSSSKAPLRRLSLRNINDAHQHFRGHLAVAIFPALDQRFEAARDISAPREIIVRSRRGCDHRVQEGPIGRASHMFGLRPVNCIRLRFRPRIRRRNFQRYERRAFDAQHCYLPHVEL